MIVQSEGGWYLVELVHASPMPLDQSAVVLYWRVGAFVEDEDGNVSAAVPIRGVNLVQSGSHLGVVGNASVGYVWRPEWHYQCYRARRAVDGSTSDPEPVSAEEVLRVMREQESA
ncbi:MAG: hypothetical protein ACRDRL_33715 [Sciscionella sp.]